MASSVATPLERSFGRIAGVTEMTSTSQLGAMNITLQLDLDRNIDGGIPDVQAAINAAAGSLPAGTAKPSRYRKINPSDAPILDIDLTSKTIPRSVLYDIADSNIGQKVSQVDGWASEHCRGLQPAVRVDLNPLALAHDQIGLSQVRAA